MKASLEQRSGAAGFDGIAPFYPSMEWLLAGGILQRARLQFIDLRPQPRRVLLVGEGHGKFLSECRRIWPEAELTVVEASLPMILEARKRLRHHSVADVGIHWVHASLEEWLKHAGDSNRFDTIVTHFFLDCFDARELGEAIRGIGRLASERARWLVADFQIPSSQSVGALRRVRARWIHACMYAFFRRVTRLPANRWVDPGPYFEREGFSLRERRTYEWGLVRSDFWEGAD